MDDKIAGFQRYARGVTAAAKGLGEAKKALNNQSPQMVQTACEKALTALEKVSGIEEVARELKANLEQYAISARRELLRERALLAGKIAQLLNEANIRVQGNLPLLHAGGLSLEFSFGAKGQCTIWFGPRVTKLANCPLDAEIIAEKVTEIYRDLFPVEFDEEALLGDIYKAYKMELFSGKLAEGTKVPLTALLRYIALNRQKQGFMVDPRKELFTTYGRTEFAADLSRVRGRTVQGMELRMDVATLAQTKRPEEHLWVPRGDGGVRYSTISFAKITR